MTPSPAQRKKRRMYMIIGAVLLLAVAAGLILRALNQNIVFFITPSEVAERGIEPGDRFRLGGLVEDGSLSMRDDGLVKVFSVTDTEASSIVHYRGILPDLFREGQGVIAEGAFDASGIFIADNVLAKHDEKYMPPELADALEKRGHPTDQSRDDPS